MSWLGLHKCSISVFRPKGNLFSVAAGGGIGGLPEAQRWGRTAGLGLTPLGLGFASSQQESPSAGQWLFWTIHLSSKTGCRVLYRPQGPSQKLYLFPWKFWFRKLGSFQWRKLPTSCSYYHLFKSPLFLQPTKVKHNVAVTYAPLFCQPNRRK